MGQSLRVWLSLNTIDHRAIIEGLATVLELVIVGESPLMFTWAVVM